MTSAPFDFRSPPASGYEHLIADWFRAASRAAQRIWLSDWNISAELRLVSAEIDAPSAIIKSLPESVLGFALRKNNQPPDAFLAMERPLLIALLSTVMGQLPKELPVDRELTAAELALVDLVVNQLLNPLRLAWPEGDAPAFQLSPPAAPRSTCKLPPHDSALDVRFAFDASFGSTISRLVLPLSGWFAASMEAKSAPPRFDRAELEASLREMPVHFTVNLGHAYLTIQQLAQLRAGDLVVLNQKVAEPLHAQVEGADRFDVWPGAQGTIQAVRIQSARKSTAT